MYQKQCGILLPLNDRVANTVTPLKRKIISYTAVCGSSFQINTLRMRSVILIPRMLKRLALLAVLAALPAAMARPCVHNSEIVSRHESYINLIGCVTDFQVL